MKEEKLFQACFTGNVSDFKLAIEECDDLNIKNNEGQTPLCEPRGRFFWAHLQ